MVRHSRFMVVLLCVMCGSPTMGITPLTHARYRVLPGEKRTKPPFFYVDFMYGPSSASAGGTSCLWQLDVREEEASEPLCQLRCVTLQDPLADVADALVFSRYQLHIPATGEVYDYRDKNSPGRALLPPWGDFVRHFVPRAVTNTGYEAGVPHSCAYLGHVLSLRWVRPDGAWVDWPDAKVLELDGEMLIGTGRVFKDAEGRRLPQQPKRQNYTFVQWTKDDYDTMIQAGVNLFALTPGIEPYLRSQPVFYRRGAGRDAPLAYPTDLYRSNLVGPMMYLDEPTCIMTGDENFHKHSKYFTDAAPLITKRVRAQSRGAVHNLETQLRGRGISFGDMVLAQDDFASWETRYETAWYQLAGGANGFVHEGRYQLDEFNTFAKASTGFDRAFTAEEMFRYYYGFMRGAARHFDKFWGTSIYGQADPKLSPLAVRLAYDMGARYLWFWTSDHGHHMPWPEQLELARVLKEHASAHRRPTIRGAKPLLDKVIVIPYGYFLVLESPTHRKNPWDLWWVREMDPDGENEASQRYRRLMQRALREVFASFDAGEEFDFTVDDGREITGYRKIVRLTDE